MGFVKELGSEFKKDKATTLAAAQAYYYLLAIVPLLILLLAILPYLQIDPQKAVVERHLFCIAPAFVLRLFKDPIAGAFVCIFHRLSPHVHLRKPQHGHGLRPAICLALRLCRSMVYVVDVAILQASIVASDDSVESVSRVPGRRWIFGSLLSLRQRGFEECFGANDRGCGCRVSLQGHLVRLCAVMEVFAGALHAASL